MSRLIAIWYVRPWLNKLGSAQALTVLLWVHVFRYTVLNILPTQRDGYLISHLGLIQLVVGDLAGAVIALAAIALLRRRARLGIALCWLLIAVFIVDSIGIFYERGVAPSGADPSGLWWLIFALFAPLVVVNPLLAWQLSTRRGEPLALPRDFSDRTSLGRTREPA